MKVHVVAGVLLLSTVGLYAQDDAPAFEVSSIKRRLPGGPSPGVGQSSPDRYTHPNQTLRDLVSDAYGLQRAQIFGGPDWMRSVRFDVTAKASFVPSSEQMREMAQRLLTERFALRVHFETRELPVFALRTSRDDGSLGGQLTRTTFDCVAIEAARQQPGGAAQSPLTADGKPICTTRMTAMPGPTFMTARYRTSGETMTELSVWLSSTIGQVVVDRTGLSGEFDLELAFDPTSSASVAAAPDAPASIFTAIQEQLGLRLESTRAPVSVLVVDSAEMPTPD